MKKKSQNWKKKNVLTFKTMESWQIVLFHSYEVRKFKPKIHFIKF